MTSRERENMRNIIGGVDAEAKAGDCDNIAIVLASYYERLPECPEDDHNEELGWSQWAIDQTNATLDRIAEAAWQATLESVVPFDEWEPAYEKSIPISEWKARSNEDCVFTLDDMQAAYERISHDQ